MITSKIKEINDNILRILECRGIKQGTGIVYGLAQNATYRDDEGSVIPLIIGNNGEENYVFSDDNYNYGVYHRILSKSYSEGSPIGWEKEQREVADMLMVVWGFSHKLQINALQFESEVIIPSLPTDVSAVSSDFDRLRVVGVEFRGINYVPIPEEFVFSVRYRISSSYIKYCKTNCIKK